MSSALSLILLPIAFSCLIRLTPLTVYFVAEDGFPPSLNIIEWATVKKAVFSEE